MEEVTVAKVGKGLTTVVKLLIVFIGISFLAGIVYWIWYSFGISWSRVKQLIAEESAKHEGKEVETERILLQGAKEVVSNPRLNKQARAFAEANQIQIERVIVDNAIAMSKNLGYISEDADKDPLPDTES